MRHSVKRRILVVLSVLLLLSSAGCPVFERITGLGGDDVIESVNTPVKRYDTATDIFASTMDVLTHMKRYGQLRQEDVDTVDKYAPIARDALEQWKEGLKAGDSSFEAISRFNGALSMLLEAQGASEEVNDKLPPDTDSQESETNTGTDTEGDTE